MMKYYNLLVVFSVIVVLGQQGAVALTCFEDPSQESCRDADTFYPSPMIQKDLRTVCDAKPWLSGCSVRAQCELGASSGQYCGGWSLLASTCLEERNGDPTMFSAGCDRYIKLCKPNAVETLVSQCNSPLLRGIPKLVTADVLVKDMNSMCKEMVMKQCDKCTGLDYKSCPDPLMAVVSVCMNHYMSDCGHWNEMCSLGPKGLTSICGDVTAKGAFDGEEELRCFGVMRMYFHTGFDDYVLFKSWVPCNSGGYAVTFIVTMLAAIFSSMLKALRTRQEQAYVLAPPGPFSSMNESSNESSASNPEGGKSHKSFIRRTCRQIFPRSRTEFQQNAVRSCFTFITMILDYSLMLIAMTFNVGLFFAVILGFALGTLLFGHTTVPLLEPGRNDDESRTGRKASNRAVAPKAGTNQTSGDQGGPYEALGPPETGSEPVEMNRLQIQEYATAVLHTMDMPCCSQLP